MGCFWIHYCNRRLISLEIRKNVRRIKMANRLKQEKSPYLLQHGENPVDWYPWGEEAFQRAAREDKPVFLSIGYSTCHWCHVMAHESFEDEEVAGLLNREFVCIKVDREERPDVDAVYMSVCQAVTGSGGWPLTILMTPEQIPFFAGTYFPKRGSYGQYGLMELLEQVASLWKTNREELLRAGNQITGRSTAIKEIPGMNRTVSWWNGRIPNWQGSLIITGVDLAGRLNFRRLTIC